MTNKSYHQWNVNLQDQNERILVVVNVSWMCKVMKNAMVARAGKGWRGLVCSHVL